MEQQKEQQKELLVEISQDMLDCANNDLEFTKTIVTGDDTWVYGYNPKSKFKFSQWKHLESPRPKKARQFYSHVKVMVTCFFDSHAPKDKTINKKYYLEVLRHLCDAVQRKQPDMWTGKNWQLHRDNTFTHSTHVIKGFLAKNNMLLVQQPPYSPNLAPCDFWLFSKLKISLKGTCFSHVRTLRKK